MSDELVVTRSDEQGETSRASARQAICSIAARTGCTTETLRGQRYQAECAQAQGIWAGLTTWERERRKQLEGEAGSSGGLMRCFPRHRFFLPSAARSPMEVVEYLAGFIHFVQYKTFSP